MNNTLPARLTSVAALMVTTASVADVPFTPLADFGLGGQPSDVNSSGIIVGAVRVENESAPSVPVIWQTSNSAPTPLPTVNGGYAVAINSIAQQAKPMGIGHSEFLRIQLIAASTRVTITLPSILES